MSVMTLQERVHGALPPSKWSLTKLHHVFFVRRRNKNFAMQETNLLSLSYGRIKRKDITGADGLLPESFETYQIVEPGDIVLRLTDLQNDKRSLRQGLVEERGIVTSAYDAVHVGLEHEPRFWFYALHALDLAKYYYSMGGGVRQSIKFSDFPNDWIAAPDLPTQRAIAAFLDRETARVDQLIEKKQRLVELLNEELVSRITQAVTSEGRKTALKFLCRKIVDCLHETPTHDPEGAYPSVRTSDISRGRLLIVQAKRVSREEYLHRIQRLEPRAGDIVYAREGDWGKAALVPEDVEVCLGQRTMMFRANDLVVPGYLMWSLNGKLIYSSLAAKVAGSTAPHVNISDIRNVPVMLPNKDRQASIASSLDWYARRHEALTHGVSASIDRLKEYRSALITDAVTGQIDVESWSRRGEGDPRLDRIEEEMAG